MCRTCHTAPRNWMCWQHNDIGQWQKAAEREAERCMVHHTWGRPQCLMSALHLTKMSGRWQSVAISQQTAHNCVVCDVTHCIIYLTGAYCTLLKLKEDEM